MTTSSLLVQSLRKNAVYLAAVLLGVLVQDWRIVRWFIATTLLTSAITFGELTSGLPETQQPRAIASVVSLLVLVAMGSFEFAQRSPMWWVVLAYVLYAAWATWRLFFKHRQR